LKSQPKADIDPQSIGIRKTHGNQIVNTSKINDRLTLLTNIAVVAGIVFLAVEIRQNNEFLQSEARYHLLTNIIEAVTDSYTNETLMSAWLKVESD